MPARYLRLIIGLLIFLGLMLMIGRINTGNADAPPLSRAEQAQMDADKRLQEENERLTTAALQQEYVPPNPYLDNISHSDCEGSRARQELDELRRYRDRIVSAVNLVDAKDQQSLDVFGEITNPMASTRYLSCLGKVPGHLYKATEAARDTHRAERVGDLGAAEMRNAIDAAMKDELAEADREMALVDAALQQRH